MKHLHLVHQTRMTCSAEVHLVVKMWRMHHPLPVHLPGTRLSRLVHHHWKWWCALQRQLDLGTGSIAQEQNQAWKKLSKFNLQYFFSSFSLPPLFFNQIHLFVLFFFFVIIHLMWKNDDAFPSFLTGKTIDVGSQEQIRDDGKSWDNSVIWVSRQLKVHAKQNSTSTELICFFFLIFDWGREKQGLFYKHKHFFIQWLWILETLCVIHFPIFFEKKVKQCPNVQNP